MLEKLELNELDEKIITYDIETDSKHAPYANLKMIGYQIGLHNKPQLVDLHDKRSRNNFRNLIGNPEWTKVSYNGVNYDELVLRRHGFPVDSNNSHDVFLMVKCCCPMLPAYGLKFVNWYFFGDPHDAERKLHAYLKHHKSTKSNSGLPMYQAPAELLRDYCVYDVTQTVRLFKLFWPIVQRSRHWEAYSQVELPMREVIHQMIMEGGDCVNVGRIRREIDALRERIGELNAQAVALTKGRVTNAASGKQVARELVDQEKFKLEVSDKGNLLLRKEDLITMLDLDNPNNDTSKLGRITYEIRDTNNQLGFLRAYRRAALYELRRCEERALYRKRKYVTIPKSYSLSTARTRRILSNSRFGINFQNQNKVGKGIQLVPTGWLGVWIDATQIENVVHIWRSNDVLRRRDYERSTEWNEYVWLTNTILGGQRSREELDRINSSVHPGWSIYKQFKTCKLALNFGMGVKKFCRTNGISEREGKQLFEQVHRACPAIRKLQDLVRREIVIHGYIQDPFGHIYSGSPDAAYKVVAYFVQGCGTGSVPKVMARAIYDTLSVLNNEYEWRGMEDSEGPQVAVMTNLVHDEIGFRIRTDLPSPRILSCLRECLECMEGRFAHRFDGIPLRAKLSLSRTNSAEAKVINHHQMSEEEWNKEVKKYLV
jgi:hypothetical protein